MGCVIDLLLLERLARRRSRTARYRCHACDREFEGWGSPETVRCPDCLTVVAVEDDGDTADGTTG
jgi:rRNA maturation endonuclease Nob1